MHNRPAVAATWSGPGQATVAVLEGMNFQKHHDKMATTTRGVKISFLPGLIAPNRPTPPSAAVYRKVWPS